jgi:hypothetical protein
VAREPIPPGVNLNMIVQDELAGRVLPQVPVPVFTNSEVFPLVVVITIEVTEVAAVFVNVKVIGEPEKPTFTLPKF